MLGDIQPRNAAQFGLAGSVQFPVAAGTTASIKAGEPVLATLGSANVSAMATNSPVVGTSYLAGIAASTSTETASLAGTVTVFPVDSNVTYLISPKVAIASQAAYNALVGRRVLIDLTAGVYTILQADSAANGCVIQPLDVSLVPGKVAFAFRSGVNYLS